MNPSPRRFIEVSWPRAHNESMKALILLGTLKKEGLSNTETLCEFVVEEMQKKGIEAEMIKLVDRIVSPGTYTDMGPGDEWPDIYRSILLADALFFATPVWWGEHSSEIQRAIERLDEVHDIIMRGEPSPLQSKLGGVIITGDGDGAEHIIGSTFNFFNAIGIAVPPFASISVLSPMHAKSEQQPKKELLEIYRNDYAQSIQKTLDSFLSAAQ